MAGVHILTDGAATLPRDADLNYGITILPYRLQWGGESLRLGRELTAEDAVRRWAASPSDHTEATGKDEVMQLTQNVLGWGVDAVTVLGPATLTPTVERARQVRAGLPDDAGLTVVETAWCGPALGLMAISAAHAGAEGAPRDEVVALVEEINDRLSCVVVRPEPRDPATGAARGASRAREDDMLWQLETLRGSELLRAAPPETLGAAMRRAVAFVHERWTATDAYEGPLHMALFSAGTDAEAAALATFFEARYAPHELWVAPSDPVLLGLVGFPAFGVAWYRLPKPVAAAV